MAAVPVIYSLARSAERETAQLAGLRYCRCASIAEMIRPNLLSPTKIRGRRSIQGHFLDRSIRSSLPIEDLPRPKRAGSNGGKTGGWLAVLSRSGYHAGVQGSRGNITLQVSEVKSKLQLLLFGDFRASLRDVDVTPTRNSAVRVLLLLSLGDSTREARPRICELLWPDADPKRARENLRQALFYLRRQFDEIGFEGLSISRTHVALDRSSVSVDSHLLLTEIVEQGRVPQKLLQSPEFLDTYLASIVEKSDSFGDWLAERRSDFRRKLHDALQQLLERPEISADEQRQSSVLLLALDPGDEVACRALMRLSVARGDTVEALRRYNALWTYMADEFDVEPSDQTQSLAVDIKLGRLKTETHREITSSSETPLTQQIDVAEVQPPTTRRHASLLVERASATTGAANLENASDLLWFEIGSYVAAKLLPEHRGRLLTSDDDRIVLSFDKTRVAVEAALALQVFATTRYAKQADVSAGSAAPLRLAVSVGGEVVFSDRVTEPDVTDLIGLAKHGEIVTSVEVTDQITHTLDANVEDLGDHGLADNHEPVRAFRLHAPRAEVPVTPLPESLQKTRSLLPTIAVIPPTTYSVSDGLIGEILADEMIAVLSVAQEANIVSRLSSRVFQNRDCTAAEIGSRLQANYIVSGRYREVGSKLMLNIELTDTSTDQVIWNEQKSGTVADFLSPEHHLIVPLTSNIIAAVMNFESQQALDAPMPTLESYTLLVSAITLMHRLSVRAFDRAREMLEVLIERLPNHSVPHAWLGYWHVLRVQQGWFDDLDEHGANALSTIERALELNPSSSLALTIRGVICTSLLHQLDDAETSLSDALQANPNQSLAWLQKSCVHAFRGEGDLAIDHAQQALHLTPLHPLRYLYDSLAGTAALSANRFDQAHEFAKRSLLVNRTHTSTLRLLAVAQWNLGYHEDAKRTGSQLLLLEPTFTVSSWRARTPSNRYKIGEEWAQTLTQIGMPT